jgi:pimeloyl-ACP methyl ester carboxylesterase
MIVRSSGVARWLDAVLDSLGVQRAPFVGFSNGAFNSATYATKRPERVERMALQQTVCHPGWPAQRLMVSASMLSDSFAAGGSWLGSK